MCLCKRTRAYVCVCMRACVCVCTLVCVCVYVCVCMCVWEWMRGWSRVDGCLGGRFVRMGTEQAENINDLW